MRKRRSQRGSLDVWVRPKHKKQGCSLPFSQIEIPGGGECWGRGWTSRRQGRRKRGHQERGLSWSPTHGVMDIPKQLPQRAWVLWEVTSYTVISWDCNEVSPPQGPPLTTPAVPYATDSLALHLPLPCTARTMLRGSHALACGLLSCLALHPLRDTCRPVTTWCSPLCIQHSELHMDTLL